MKIAVKLPNELSERILAFPFLHGLNKFIKNKQVELAEDEQIELHLICTKDNIDVLNLLPFKAFYHELENEDVKSVFSIHRAIVNSKLDNIDIYISSTESFIDASISKNLRATQTIGLAIGKNKFFFNKKIAYLKGQHQSDVYYYLLKGLLESELPPVPNTYSRELTPLYPDWRERPYMMVNLDLVGNELNLEWKELFDLFSGYHIILMSDQLDITVQKERIQDYIRKLGQQNSYEIFEYENNIDFAKLVGFAHTFISCDSSLIHLASYVGAHSFWLNKTIDSNRIPVYSIGDVRQFNLNASEFKSDEGVNYSPIFDEIFKFINSRLILEKEEATESPK